VLVSSAIFGLAHLFNLALGRQTLLAGLTQVVYSFFFGVAFAACFLRNRSIWPAIVMHAAVDLGGSLLQTIAVGGGQPAVVNGTIVEAASTIAITLFLFLYGLFILRKVTPENMLRRQQDGYFRATAYGN